MDLGGVLPRVYRGRAGTGDTPLGDFCPSPAGTVPLEGERSGAGIGSTAASRSPGRSRACQNRPASEGLLSRASPRLPGRFGYLELGAKLCLVRRSLANECLASDRIVI